MVSYIARHPKTGDEVDIRCVSTEAVRFDITVTNQESGDAIDITSATILMEAREDASDDDDAPISINAATATANDSVVTITDGASGEAQFYISEEDVAATFAAGSNYPQATEFAYNILVTPAGGDRSEHLSGRWIIAPSPSKPS